MNEIEVNIIFDDCAKVYVATSKDVPGLVAEAPTFEILRDKVLSLIPVLMEANQHLIGAIPTVPVDLLIRQKELVALC